jgi:hypothetical protein
VAAASMWRWDDPTRCGSHRLPPDPQRRRHAIPRQTCLSSMSCAVVLTRLTDRQADSSRREHLRSRGARRSWLWSMPAPGPTTQHTAMIQRLPSSHASRSRYVRAV